MRCQVRLPVPLRIGREAVEASRRRRSPDNPSHASRPVIILAHVKHVTAPYPFSRSGVGLRWL